MAQWNVVIRYLAIACCTSAFFLSLPAATAHAKPVVKNLKVAPNHRYLVHADGSPFFYLGDTVWELFHRARREEADEYLQDRAARGFTVIQAVVLAEFDGLNVPNAYGHLPLENQDPEKPVEDYFRHVDYIVEKAQKLGLHVGMLPAWGDKWNKKWGQGPEVFTPANAEKFGEFLGRRYRDRPIIWILGGDRNPETDEHRNIVRAMARGLKKGDGGRHLMTYHPMGWSNSSTWFHHDAWLDFNMFQSGHNERNRPNYFLAGSNRQLNPPKPSLDGEPRYEDGAVDFKVENGLFDDFDVRQAAYWSLLAGSCGHVYGHHSIWQLSQPDRQPLMGTRGSWRAALSQPGAVQMGHVRRLFESRPFMQLVPDQGIILPGPGGGIDHIRAALADDGSFAFVYTPTGKTLAVPMNRIKGQRVRASWYNPRDGVSTEIGLFAASGVQQFVPPTSGRGNDWVLVLDDAGRSFVPPGARVAGAAAR